VFFGLTSAFFCSPAWLGEKEDIDCRLACEGLLIQRADFPAAFFFCQAAPNAEGFPGCYRMRSTLCLHWAAGTDSLGLGCAAFS
jgi:hypothetical protein